ncbi:DNA/RNA-binding domain of Phe-tRNA-synthetase-like protein [Dongia mobilis]|uniref:DNA/RNA-binding domain of Phe-tRNA-synthetase-like protein n=1 Tax=Dongia mobilis TaxID=578943 RepID=A0A4V3DEQ3_9PROT|nr:phenylalanine--tRNA ligase beta subunit-related protein [Dongia mobilis]TDQ82368.1 DNA/RNA-binding domain of Phe-tRNA-synthetase-like protein [Dongia mobilis]
MSAAPMVPSIDPRIAELAPDFRAFSIVMEAGGPNIGSVAEIALDDAYKAAARNQPDWAGVHLAAWAQVFQRFGAKPQRTPCSAEALRKRFLRDGALPRVNPVVDLYNAISLQFAVPVGGENLEAYVGSPRLTIADGTEAFDTMKDGSPVIEAPEPNEVIWRDDLGVTCRRWNWRQGVRTRLDADARCMWFILESLSPMPLEALQAAGAALVAGLQAMSPDARIRADLLTLPGL